MYESGGAEQLEGFRVPLLSWEEVQEHKAEAEAAALPASGSAPRAIKAS